MSSPSDHRAAGPDGPGAAAVPPQTVEDLMAQMVQRANDIIATQKRLRGLLAANRSIVGELSLPKVLQRIVEAAGDTAGARYAGLAVLNADGSLDSLVHSGMDEEMVARIRERPTGTGLLGALAVAGTVTPLVADDPGSRPRAAAPAPGTFLEMPIRAQGSVYGTLYVVDPVDGGRFTEEDEDLVAALAATAGIAVENARLYDESRRRQEWLLASSEISQRLLAANDDEVDVWRLIAANVRHLADAEVAVLVVPLEEDEGRLRVVVAAGAGEQELPGTVFLSQDSVADVAMREGRGAVVDSGRGYGLRFPGRPEEFVGSMMALPVKGEWGPRGAIVICRQSTRPVFTPADVDMAGDFADQAAIALELADARAAQQRVGALEDRERIARDLHDHVIQRLFATGLSLQSTAGSVVSPMVRERLGRSVQELDETIRQIRTSIFALRYSRPVSASVRATALAVVEELTATLGFRPSIRLSGPLDSFADEDLVSDVAVVLRESLTEVSRHSGARSAAVSVETDGATLLVLVTDDGPRRHDRPRGSDFADLRERAERRGGELTVDPSGEGLRLTWSTPVT